MNKHRLLRFLRPVAVLLPISTRTRGIGVRSVPIAIQGDCCQTSARTGAESHGVIRKRLYGEDFGRGDYFEAGRGVGLE